MFLVTKIFYIFLFINFSVLNFLSLLTVSTSYSQPRNHPQLTTLRGSFGLGEGDVTSTIYVGKDAYDIYFPDNMLDKQSEAIEKLINECSTAKNMMCEIVCLVELAPPNDEYHGYIKDIKSIKPIIISASHSDSSAIQQIGPVVFGLYLGMPYDKAVQVLKKEGYDIEEFKIHESHRKADPSMPYIYNFLKNGIQFGRFNTLYEKGAIYDFGLSLSLFGVKDYDQLNFARQFLDYYKLPYSPEMLSITKGKQLNLSNRQLGYQISFPSSRSGFVVINTIQKNSDIQFK